MKRIPLLLTQGKECAISNCGNSNWKGPVEHIAIRGGKKILRLCPKHYKGVLNGDFIIDRRNHFYSV